MSSLEHFAPIKIGIVGAGTAARQMHLPLIAQRPDLFTITAIADISAASLSKVASRWGFQDSQLFTSVESMLESPDKPDAILVLNSGSHLNSVIAGLAAGCSVLCEKPLAYSLDEVGQIRQALARSSGRLMVGYMKTHDLVVLRAKELIETLALTAIDVEVLHPSEQRQLLTGELGAVIPTSAPSPSTPTSLAPPLRTTHITALGSQENPFASLYSDILMGSIIHEFSVLRELGSPIASVDYVLWDHDHQTNTSVIIVGKSATGHPITIRWYYVEELPEYRETIQWIGTKGEVRIEFPTPYSLYSPTKLTTTLASESATIKTQFTSPKDAFEIELEDFAAIVRDQRIIPKNGCDQAEADVILAQKIIREMSQGEGVPLAGELKID